jgi:uncharacterized membrane protein
MTQINRVSAQDLGRIAALSDGIFAFAMTVLVLEIHVPDSASIHSEAALWTGLTALAPRVVTWLLSLMTLGIFWVGQQTLLNHLTHSDRDLSWLSFAYLAAVTVLPFSTRLLAGFIIYELAFLIYWLNIVLCGVGLMACLIYAERAGLIKTDAPPHFAGAFRRRIIIAQTLYAFGAALGLIGVPLGIGFIVLVQLNFALALRLPYLREI